MQKRTASIVLASTLAVGGGAVALTPASAADSDSPVKSRLASIKSSLSSLVQDGTLTQDQVDKVATTLDEKMPQGRRGHGGRGEHLAAAAKVLGLSESELKTKLKDGKSLADIAKAEDVSVDSLVKALVVEAEERIDAAVKEDKLTTTQAAERKKNLTKQLTDRVNSVRPEGDAGRPFGGARPKGDSSKSDS